MGKKDNDLEDFFGFMLFTKGGKSGCILPILAVLLLILLFAML